MTWLEYLNRVKQAARGLLISVLLLPAALVGMVGVFLLLLLLMIVGLVAMHPISCLEPVC